MNSSELMLAAIGNGLEDDTTTSAALDAIREESNCSLLAAVLEVARVHKATKDARELTEAVTYLATGSSYKTELENSILAECLNVPTTAITTIVPVDGDQWPRAEVKWEDGADHLYPIACVTVGAHWVKCEVNRIQIERERAGRKPTTRRAVSNNTRHGGSR